MNSHALTVLEFDRVLDTVAGRASSDEGSARVRALRPTTDRDWIEREQTRVFSVRALLSAEGGWAPARIPHARRALDRLRVENATLGGDDFVELRTLLASSRTTLDSLEHARYPAAARAVLAPIARRLAREPRAESAIDRVINDEGEVRDEASPRLRSLRRELRTAESDLVSLLERIAARLEPGQQVMDMSVTVRNGRYVIPVRREGRAAVGGIVHDASATGGTLFMEPPAAIEAGNRMRELAAQELREVDRILGELTESVRPFHAALDDAFDAMGELDSLYARARYALELRASPVLLRDPVDGFDIHNGRHPLLLAQGHAVVPFDLSLTTDDRTLLISGPNTGGKTVLLKAIALISASIQAGVPATVGDESTIPVYDDIYADIGDEQSIAASLSTFSAHVKNLREILTCATDRTLVLIDELGSGTDPLEGAALGGAVLESLTNRGARTVATTHLGALKHLAVEDPRVVNASLQFDAVALAPTYRLIKGIPGQSYGLSIARRLGVPEEVLDRAEARLPAGERDVNVFLADLEARDTALGEREREAEAIAEDARVRARRVAERERNAEARERDAERKARQEARRYLLGARREVEQAIESLKSSADVDEAARDARRRVEDLAKGQTAALDRLDVRERSASTRGSSSRNGNGRSEAPGVGDWVSVESLGGRTGKLLELRDDSGVVAVGPLKLTVPVGDLARAARPQAAITVAVRGDVPDVFASSEIDLRGMRVGDVDDIVMHAVDNAVRADLKALRIIHGKGTGALRDRVGEMLKKEPRVVNFRLGAWNEGGAGVTVVEFS
ncbi:MAG: endonuclease MutS2 [Gemmatimonadaceae bacterium]